MSESADIQFQVSTVGLIIPFVFTENGAPISNALSAVVTWKSSTGAQRPLTLTSPISAEFQYVTTGHDFRSPRSEEGYCVVSFGPSIFFSSAFTVKVTGHFD
jgi:hypothetical protein